MVLGVAPRVLGGRHPPKPGYAQTSVCCVFCIRWAMETRSLAEAIRVCRLSNASLTVLSVLRP